MFDSEEVFKKYRYDRYAEWKAVMIAIYKSSTVLSVVYLIISSVSFFFLDTKDWGLSPWWAIYLFFAALFFNTALGIPAHLMLRVFKIKTASPYALAGLVTGLLAGTPCGYFGYQWLVEEYSSVGMASRLLVTVLITLLSGILPAIFSALVWYREVYLRRGAPS